MPSQPLIKVHGRSNRKKKRRVFLTWLLPAKTDEIWLAYQREFHAPGGSCRRDVAWTPARQRGAQTGTSRRSGTHRERTAPVQTRLACSWSSSAVCGTAPTCPSRPGGYGSVLSWSIDYAGMHPPCLPVETMQCNAVLYNGMQLQNTAFTMKCNYRILHTAHHGKLWCIQYKCRTVKCNAKQKKYYTRIPYSMVHTPQVQHITAKWNMGCGTCAGRSERLKKQTQQQQTGERQATKKVSKKGAGATFSSQTKCMATRTACILFKNTIFLPSGQVGYLFLQLDRLDLNLCTAG